jgi:hypothetical protein
MNISFRYYMLLCILGFSIQSISGVFKVTNNASKPFLMSIDFACLGDQSKREYRLTPGTSDSHETACCATNIRIGDKSARPLSDNPLYCGNLYVSITEVNNDWNISSSSTAGPQGTVPRTYGAGH